MQYDGHETCQLSSIIIFQTASSARSQDCLCTICRTFAKSCCSKRCGQLENAPRVKKFTIIYAQAQTCEKCKYMTIQEMTRSIRAV